MTRRQHYVRFYSPGTFVCEETCCEIHAWDAMTAASLARGIVERYNAKPFGFRFETRIVSDPVPDGEGGTLDIEPKKVAESGMHFLTGRVISVDEVRAKADPGETILLANMECNDWPYIVVNNNSFRSVQPFSENDVVVDLDGNVIERGDSPDRVEYRRRKIAEHRERVEREWARR